MYQVYLGSRLLRRGIQVGDSRVYVTHPLVDFSWVLDRSVICTPWLLHW